MSKSNPTNRERLKSFLLKNAVQKIKNGGRNISRRTKSNRRNSR